jgi:hypothetical protein
VTEHDVLAVIAYVGTRARMSRAGKPSRADDTRAPHDLLLLGPPGRLLGLKALNGRPATDRGGRRKAGHRGDQSLRRVPR